MPAFVKGDIVVDEQRTRVGRVAAVHGACLVLSRPCSKWDALASSCRLATPTEASSLNAWDSTPPPTHTT
ncbi:hypothetical protein [Streptomyces catenulae]|uniref:Uncharacterized protein n=1 Tax=Streptomyces catenulae TaxID=66875 RepID=A0ABV2YTI0_9ACTN|nr:hypothetical protein [Streptomyces catenulae]